MDKLDPTDALEQVIFLGARYPARYGYREPGEVIGRARPEVREALGRLTSDALARMRSYPDDDERTREAREVSRRKLAMDARAARPSSPRRGPR